MAQKFTLPASKRLKSQKLIAQLFAEGQSGFVYPFKLLYLISESNPNDASALKFTVSVPKKKIKSAVSRNLVKRRTREAFRLHSIPLQQAIQTRNSCNLSIMFVYIENSPEDYTIIEKSVVKHLKFLVDAIPD